MLRDRKLKFLTFSFISIGLITFLFSAEKAQEPVRGKALYEKLRKEARNLVKYEGLQTVSWTPDGKAFYIFEENTFKRIDALTGEKTNLFDDAKIITALNTLTGKQEVKLPFRNFNYLAEGQKIQFTAYNKVFIYELVSSKILYFYEPEEEIVGVRGRVYREVLSPDLKYRAYTKNYNLYVKDIDGNEKALTTNGHQDLRNGFPDWVYPEELGQYDAFWWSPDSKKIAYMQFDESPVAKYPIVHDVDPMPRLELLSYPKAGANNPIVRLFIVDVETKKTVQVDSGRDLDVYLYRGRWTKDGKEFTFQRLNRLQNVIEVWAADPDTGKTRVVLHDEDPCYIDENVELIFLGDNKHFLFTSERSGWQEIYLYDLSGKLVKQLTNARLPVARILGVDEARGWVYFSGYETRGLEMHLYRVKLDGTQFTKMSKEPGTHTINFAPGYDYYTDNFTSFDEPRRITLHEATTGKEIRSLGTSVITEELKNLKLIKPEHFTFKSADGKYDLDAILYFPAHFNENEKYPLILSVYGGPGSKRIFNRFNLIAADQALAQLGFLVLIIDHRGVSGRGKAFQNLQYLNLGHIELEDHVAAVKAVSARPYVDSSRVGIYGHSYGGYLTSIALLKAPDVFHVGVAGAPVTDWRNYDTIYTERYMRRPQDNPEGYEKGSCLTYARNLKGKLFIHHGAVDDNVHVGNSIQLINALLKENKAFDFMIYPEQQHGIRFERYAEARVEYFITHLKPDVK